MGGIRVGKFWDDQNPKYFDSYSTHWSGGKDLEFV